MKKNILFSLALCAGLLLPQGSCASQSWSDWGMQGLKSAAQTAYSYLPSASSLSNWATNLVNSLSEEQKNSLRIALGMSAAFTAAGGAGYYYTQRQRQLAQEVERVKKDLEQHKDNSPARKTAEIVCRYEFNPITKSLEKKALEQIFKEDICPYLKTLNEEFVSFINDVLSKAQNIYPYSWLNMFNWKILNSLRMILTKTACNTERLNEEITRKMEEEMEQEKLRNFESKIQQEQSGIIKRSAQWKSKEAAPTSVPFIAEKKVKLELSPEQFEKKVVKAQATIEDMMQQVGKNEASLGRDQTGITVAVIATIIGNCGTDKSKLQNAAFEKYFEENVCQVFKDELFNDDQFVIQFVTAVVKKTSDLYPSIPVKNILKSFRILVFKCDNTKKLLKYLDLMISELSSVE